jgi:hypothetical protein
MDKNREYTPQSPNEDGYWWWKKTFTSKEELSLVTILPSFRARFFNGSEITGQTHGFWRKAEVQ